MRQAIELYGKHPIGYSKTLDCKGRRIKRIQTQVAREFLRQEKQGKKRISLPVDIDTILEIERWSNDYVNTGLIPKAYLVENSINFIRPLIYPLNQIKNCNGFIHEIGNATIKNTILLS